MKSLMAKIIGVCLGLSLATGVGVGIVAGQREVKEANADSNISTLTFTAKCNGSGTANDGASWTVTSDAAESDFDSDRGIHYGTGKVSVSYLNLTTTSISGTISKIVVNASGAKSTAAKLNVTIGGNAFGSEQSLTSSATNYTLTGSASGTIVVALSQESAKKALYCKSIAVTYDNGGAAPVLSNLSISGDMTKTSYKTTDSAWNPAGLTVSASYTIGSPKDVTDDVTWSYSPATPSSTSTTSVRATASYTEGGVTKTAYKDVFVTVSEPEATGEFTKFSGSLIEGDYVVVYNNGAMKANITSNRLDYEDVTPSNNKITDPDPSLVWHIAPNGDYWTFYNDGVASYAAGNGTKNQAALETTLGDGAKWTVEAVNNSNYDFTNLLNSTAGVNALLRRNTTYGFACYAAATGGALNLYKAGAEKAIVDQKISGSVSASNYSTEWDTTNLKFEVKYEGDTNFTNVTNQATFIVNAAIPEITETTTTQVSVTGTYNKNTSITDTRNVTAYLNFVELEDTTIERLYFETLGDRNGHYFYGQYMGYAARTRGTTTYYDLYVGNGDYAILVYGAMTEEPTFTPFETYLKISNGYLGNFSNLYEVIDYDSENKIDYNVVVEELTDETETARVAPVTTYNMTGLENGSLPEYQRTASRLAAVGGVVKSISGTISSTTTATVTITLDNGNDVSVYINKSTASLDYDNLASKIVVNNRVAIKGFTSIHNSTYQMVLPFAIEIPDPYTAETFAQDLINATAAICATQQDGNAKALSKVWATLQTEKFVCLTLAEKNILKNSAAVENGTTIENAMARYDLICVKYRLTNFIERSSAVPASNLMNFFGLDSSNGAVASVVIVLTLVMSSAAAFFILKKKKHN